MGLEMKKIPIKIIQVTSPGGDTKKGAILDSQYYFQMEEGSREKIKAFEKLYFQTVEKAKKIFPKKRTERKASHFWKMGNLLYNFDKSIKNEFEITNFHQAIIRDFGLYNRSVVGHTLQFGEFFKEKDIDDKISMSHYMELIWKANMLQGLGKLESEKKRLLKMAKNKTLLSHKEYREELNNLVKIPQKTISKKELEKIRIKKLKERGAFEKNLFLIDTDKSK